MANDEHLSTLKNGVDTWNTWRDENPDLEPDLRRANLLDSRLPNANLQRANLTEADLTGADLSSADLRYSTLEGARLERADLKNADLRGANAKGANLSDASLMWANLGLYFVPGEGLRGVDFTSANLTRANFYYANLDCATFEGACLIGAYFICAKVNNTNFDRANLAGASFYTATLVGATLQGADLTGADLERAVLIDTDLTNATLTDCRVFGVSTWRVQLEGVKSSNLRVTPKDEPSLTVDNLEVAQFVYLLLHNEKIRGVIDTIGRKAVLILGRFTPERKAVLDAIRQRLRELGYVPMLFDFERPTQRDFTETLKTLAGMCVFIIADVTNPKSSPLELQATVPDYMVPFVPILQSDESPFSMFVDVQNKYGGPHGWVLDVLKYDTLEDLIEVLEPAIVRPALERADDLRVRKAQAIRERHVSDYSR